MLALENSSTVFKSSPHKWATHEITQCVQKWVFTLLTKLPIISVTFDIIFHLFLPYLKPNWLSFQFNDWYFKSPVRLYYACRSFIDMVFQVLESRDTHACHSVKRRKSRHPHLIACRRPHRHQHRSHHHNFTTQKWMPKKWNFEQQPQHIINFQYIQGVQQKIWKSSFYFLIMNTLVSTFF